jgi:hypothetical protein
MGKKSRNKSSGKKQKQNTTKKQQVPRASSGGGSGGGTDGINTNGSSNKTNPTVVPAAADNSYSIMTKDGISTQKEIQYLISSVEERPSKHHGNGLFLKQTKGDNDKDKVKVKDKVNHNNNIVVMKEGTRFKTLNPKIGKSLIPFPFKLNSPLSPPWYELFVDNDEEMELADYRQIWIDYIEKEDSLANCWIYYEHDRLAKNASMKQLLEVQQQDHQADDGTSKSLKSSSSFDFVRIKAIELKFLCDVKSNDELVRAYGHEWLCTKFCYFQQLVMKITTKSPMLVPYTRFLIDVKSMEMIDFIITDLDDIDDDDKDCYPWNDEVKEAEADGRRLYVATVDDLDEWSRIIDYLAKTVIAKNNHNDDDRHHSNDSNANTKLFITHWNATIDYVRMEIEHTREEFEILKKELKKKKKKKKKKKQQQQQQQQF